MQQPQRKGPILTGCLHLLHKPGVGRSDIGHTKLYVNGRTDIFVEQFCFQEDLQCKENSEAYQQA